MSQHTPPDGSGQGGWGAAPPGGPPPGAPPPQGAWGAPPDPAGGALATAPKGAEWGAELVGPKNPIVALLLNLLCCVPLGHFYLGQTKKGLLLWVAIIVLSISGVGSLVGWIIAIIDAYQLAERTNRQGSIRDMENGLDLLDHVFGPRGIFKP